MLVNYITRMNIVPTSKMTLSSNQLGVSYRSNMFGSSNLR